MALNFFPPCLIKKKSEHKEEREEKRWGPVNPLFSIRGREQQVKKVHDTRTYMHKGECTRMRGNRIVT
jgi:hypothetical protein